MLKLPNITLCAFCWGEQYTRDTLRSMRICMDKVNFGKAIMLTNCLKDEVQQYGIQTKDLNFPLNSNMKNDDENRAKFSELMLHFLDEAVDTDFCLTTQSDSTIINVESWTDEFLDYDYIGAPWPIKILTSSDMCANKISYFPNRVGNGGFSIRSKKFLKCSLGLDFYHKNEDLNVCIFNYQKMRDRGVTFAPQELACRFSLEHPIENVKEFNRDLLFTYNSFGFHGDFNQAGMKYIEEYNL